eukprot:711733-Prymnesium_polylepis.1
MSLLSVVVGGDKRRPRKSAVMSSHPARAAYLIPYRVQQQHGDRAMPCVYIPAHPHRYSVHSRGSAPCKGLF